MTSQERRDPLSDHLLTPENAALLIIDYQPAQIDMIRSMEARELVANTVSLAQAAKLFKLPMILSTVAVKVGVNGDTVPAIKAAMSGATWIDRSSINAWEDKDFVDAVKATGRKKLIMGALVTEVCLAFPVLDALRDGYEVYTVIDAVGGSSKVAHEAALHRIYQAGGRPVSWISVLCELQRDWARQETAPGMARIAAENGGSWSTGMALKEPSSKAAA